MGIIGQHRKLLWSIPEDFLPLKSTQKSKAQYPTILAPSAEHLWNIPLAPKYLPYCRKSPQLIVLPGISPNTASFVEDFCFVFKSFFFLQIQIPLRKWSFYSHSGGNLLITSCCIVVISYTKKKRGTFLLDWEEKVILEPGKLKWSVEAREQNSDSRNIVSRENFKSCFWSFRALSPGMIILARSNEKWWVLAAGLKS